MRTYQTLYEGEVRAVEITINDQNGQDFEPDEATAKILDSNDNVVVAEQDAMISGNQIYTIVGTATTSNVGTYKIIWKITKGSYIYYHSTDLEVHDL
jgi:hypothetical protein